jgi:PDZ domain-containing protein
MGQLKALLPWRHTSLIEHQLRSLLDAGVEQVVVVIGHDAERLKPIIEAVDGSDPRTVSVTLGTREDDPTIGFLGIGPQTRWEDVEDLPVDVGVRTDQVGGNSAGLALTLAILDLLTPGELTGGLQVAGTGTIDLEGQVGPIGGIRQKVIAARRAGMDVLLVPRNELP